MTGEITLRGRVLAIGGLREKLLAAARAGVTEVLIPEANKKDLEEVPADILEKLNVIFVRQADEVLKRALVRRPSPPSPVSLETADEKPNCLRAPNDAPSTVGA